jgi:protein phosphatase PTC1
MAAGQETHSECTAIVAFVRIEDDRGGQSFLTTTGTQLTNEPEASSSSEGGEVASQASGSKSKGTSTPNGSRQSDTNSGRTTPSDPTRNNSGSKIRNAMRSITSKLGGRSGDEAEGVPLVKGSRHVPFEPNRGEGVNGKRLRRVLYAGNAGDARAVLCRGGEVLRLTYDHKGSDAQESKRVMDAGGFVMNNRVNGVLAVTRSLGDSAMKDFVVGPYTTETELSMHDEFLIMLVMGYV